MRTTLLLLLPLALCAGGNSIRGTILDPAGRPIEGAQVSCNGQNVFTSAEGRFQVSGTDQCEAQITKPGFAAQTTQLASSAEVRITLAVAGPTETVVVSATRTEATPEQAAVSASVITQQQLTALNYPMLSDVLRDVPGLQVSQYGPRGALATIYTRGAERTGTLVLLDGVPLNDPGGEIHLENLTSEGIDRVEIVRGPQSALFGAEAAAGVIQLFTKHGEAEEKIPHGSFSYERGNFQTDRWIAGLNGGLASRIDYSLSAAEIHTVGEWPNTFNRNNSGMADIGYQVSNSTELRGIFRAYDAVAGVPGQIAYGVDDLAPNEHERDDTVALRLDDSRGSHFHQQFSFGFHRLTDRYNDDEPFGQQPLAALVRELAGPPPAVYFVSLVNPNAPPPVIPPGLTLVQSAAYFGPFDSLNLTERKIAGYQGTLTHGGGALVFGYDFQDQSGVLSGTVASRDNHGFFANVQQSLGSRIYFSGGARLEHSSAFGTIGSGRGGTSVVLLREHGPLPSATLRLSAGRGVTEPSLLENYVRVPPYEIGNPALRPEETTTYEAAVVSEWWGRRVKTEIAAFRNSFHNLIAYVEPTWQNIEASWARGVETSAQASMAHNVLVTGTYMWLNTRITASTTPTSSATGIGDPLVRRPRNSGSVVVMATPRRWSLAVGGTFVGERQDADFTFGITRNPGYQNVFASVSYDATKHVTPILRIDNLLNENYQEVLGYPALSRSVMGGVRVHW